jgi:hypothetical protein
MSPNFCVDCEHHDTNVEGLHTCNREMVVVTDVDLVTGVKTSTVYNSSLCYNERHYEDRNGAKTCGEEGAHFKEKKEVDEEPFMVGYLVEIIESDFPFFERGHIGVLLERNNDSSWVVDFNGRGNSFVKDDGCWYVEEDNMKFKRRKV